MNSMTGLALGVVSFLLLITAITGIYVMFTRSPPESGALIDWKRHRLGPRDSLRVYWVGHSLMEAQVNTSEGKLRLLEIVGLMAEAQGLVYAMGDHTLWGHRYRYNGVAGRIPRRAAYRKGQSDAGSLKPKQVATTL
jgi:hypothetical protein